MLAPAAAPPGRPRVFPQAEKTKLILGGKQPVRAVAASRGDAITLAQGAGIYNAVLRSDLWALPALGTGHYTASV